MVVGHPTASLIPSPRVLKSRVYHAVMAGRRRGTVIGAWGAAVLVSLGCVAWRPAPPATPRPAAQYLAIAREGNRRLEIDFDRLNGPDRTHLAAAKADLRDAAAAERAFDRQLRAIAFPPAIDAVADRLDAANQARARLTTEAAHSTSLRQLYRYEKRLVAANVPVEQQVSTIRSQLGLPPPATS